MDVVRQLETLVGANSAASQYVSKNRRRAPAVLARSGAKTHAAEPTPEELLPLESTGTYGRF